MNSLTILMTGAGAPGAPGIIQCYRKNGERDVRIVGCDMNDKVSTINMLDAFYQIPPAKDDKFIPRVLEIAIQEKVDVIQPLVTRELELFAKYEKVFAENHIAVCISPLEHLEIANNKGKLLERLKENSIDVPGYVTIQSADEFKSACVKMGYPDEAICFKPTVSNGSRGFRIIDPLNNEYEQLFNEKPNSTYIDIDRAEAILRSREQIPELLVMEFLPGEEYSVDMLVNNGETICAVPRKRLKMNGGISTWCKVEEKDDIIHYCIRIASVLKLHGNVGIQARYDKNGVIKILEINPRVQGSIVCCAAAGVNLPYLAIKQALGEPVGTITVKWGTEMVRHWKEVYYDAEGHAFAY